MRRRLCVPRSAFCILDLNGQRGVAAGAAQDDLAIEHDSHDGIIHVPHDWAVVDQEKIRDSTQTLEGLSFVDADGLIAEVAAGSDYR